MSSNSHIHTWLLKIKQNKNISLTIQTCIAKWCLCFLIHCLVCHSFPSKEQVSLNFMAAITICIDFRVQGKKICHCFHFSPPICHEVMGLDAMILVFWVLNFKPAFATLFFHTYQEPLHFLPLDWYHLHNWGCWYFFQQSRCQLLIHPALHLP